MNVLVPEFIKEIAREWNPIDQGRVGGVFALLTDDDWRRNNHRCRCGGGCLTHRDPHSEPGIAPTVYGYPNPGARPRAVERGGLDFGKQQPDRAYRGRNGVGGSCLRGVLEQRNRPAAVEDRGFRWDELYRLRGEAQAELGVSFPGIPNLGQDWPNLRCEKY